MNNEIVLIKGAYGDGNIGDDLLLEMVIDFLKSEGFHSNNIIVTGNKVKYMSRIFEDIKVIELARARFISSDYIILGGGTQFFSFSNQPLKNSRIKVILKILIQNPIIISDILKNIFKKKNKAKKIALGIGLGPFNNMFSEYKVKEKLLNFDEIYCRDRQSLTYCEKWGIKAKLTADLCLSDFFKQKYFHEHNLSTGSKKKIGIVLRDWSQNEHGEIINLKMLDFISKDEDFEIKIFVFSKIKDFLLISRIIESNLINKENIHIWDPELDSFSNYLKTINFCDILITTRYHAAIFALNFSIPTICLAIDPKLKHLVQEVNGYKYCEIRDIQYLYSMINNIFQNYNEIQREIKNSYMQLNNRSNLIVNALF